MATFAVLDGTNVVNVIVADTLEIEIGRAHV